MRRAGGEPFQWESLVPRLLHPMQVEIIEAMWWIGRPLAASELEEVFDRAYGLSHINYHVVRLKKLGALRKVGREEVRGATKNYYVVAAGQ
jgi:hypothetical protein